MEFHGEPAYNLDEELVFRDWMLNILAISRVVKVMDNMANALLTKNPPKLLAYFCFNLILQTSIYLNRNRVGLFIRFL